MTARPSIRGLLFDLDGTLLDPSPATVEALAALLIAEGRPPPGGYRPPLSIGVAALLDRFFGPLAPAELAALERRFEALWCAYAPLHLRLYDGVDAALEAVERRELPWGIVTNRAATMVEPILAALGLRSRLRCLVTGSSGIAKKPSPAMLVHAAAELGVAPARCVYVGDAASDVEAASAAGMRSLVAAWGAGCDAQGEWSRLADAVLVSPEAIHGAIVADASGGRAEPTAPGGSAKSRLL